MDATRFGRGAGEGQGVHVCTGPVAVRGAEPGDVLEVRILGRAPAAVREPAVRGEELRQQRRRVVGLSLQGPDLTEPRPREVVTIYEIDATGERNWATAVYNFRWAPQTDPSGVVHRRSTIRACRSTTPPSP